MYIHVNAKSRLSKTAALLIAFALLLSLFGCAVNACRDKLPDGSALVWIEGGGHVMMYEKPVYHAFRERIVTYLSK